MFMGRALAITGVIENWYLSFMWRVNACPGVEWRVCIEWSLVMHNLIGGK